MAEVAAQNRTCRSSLQFDENIAGAAAQVENAGLWTAENVLDALNEQLAPEAVDVKGEQMIQQIIAGRDTGKHAPDPIGGFALSAGARRRGALGGAQIGLLHCELWRVATIACRIKSGSMPETTSTSPMAFGSTKCTLPCSVFLSLARREMRFCTSRSEAWGRGP